MTPHAWPVRSTATGAIRKNTPRYSKITSLSLRSCFVQTKAIVSEGQQIYVRC